MKKMMYCTACEQTVRTRRDFEFLDVLLVIFTLGLWLIALPFFGRCCPICGNSDSLREP